MNQTQPYMDMHPASHISTGPSYSHAATAGSMPHYPQYPQASVMPPGPAHYGQPAYPAYGYHPVTSPQSAGPLPSMMPGANPQPYGSASGPPNSGYATNPVPFDTTGQIAPPGMKPRVTATLWEDEGSLCFQVEAKGVCVARREDNHFINGTKLLNVAGMTRGRRDGILKSEKTRHVVKIGPMHLKGVWIPFDRALEFAHKEKITDQLYPLFVHNIGGLLYNPENQSRTSAVAAAAADRRRVDGPDASRPSQPSQAPSLHHHHSMQSNASAQVPPTPHSIAPHSTAGRPNLDRAHTFPTPPTSASSVMGMNNSGSSYDWGTQNMPNGVNGSQPLSIDTGLSNARSMPTTPATTPPGNNVQNVNSYSSHQSYDSKHYFTSTPGSQAGYANQTNGRFDGYKTDMPPPNAPNTGSSDISHDAKTEQYSGHGTSNEPNDHQDNTYPSQYPSSRTQYGYSTNADQHHLSPEMTSSPSHHNNSGRATPRTMPTNQTGWSQDYQTPPRTSSTTHVYGTIGGDTRSSGAESYVPSSYSASSHVGAITGKRGRDDDDDGRSGGQDLDTYKRQKISRPESFGMPLSQNVHMQAIKSGGGLPRQR